MKALIGLAAVVLTVIGHLPYIRDIFLKKTRPHVFTWLVWSIVTAIAFLGQVVAGGGPGSWTTGVTGVITIFIMLLAIKYGSDDITRSDKLFLVAALVAIIPWWLTKDPTGSVILATLIDICAFIPTIRKTYRKPESETLFTYALNIFRHGLSFFALTNYNVATYLYPASLFVMNAIMTGVILNPKRRTLAS